MKFTLSKKNPVVKWPVTIPVPADDGEIQKMKIWLDFEVLTLEELSVSLPADVRMDETARESFADFMVAHTKGWHEVYGEDGNPLEFNDQNYKLLLNRSYAQAAIAQAYRECIEGRKAKN